MTGYRVVFRREALQQLEDLYDYIADAGSPDDAARYTDAIVTYCQGFTDFPNLGRARDDIRPGLRTIGYKRRVVIAFAVLDDTVAIVGIFYGGRDYETILAAADPEEVDS